MGRGQLVDVLEEGLICGGVLECEVVFKGGGVKLLFKAGVGKEGLYLRAEHEHLPELCVVEGLNAEHIPCAEKGLFIPVPDDEGEHPPQLFRQAAAVFLVTVDKHL